MKKVLLTGATGFIGQNCIPYLLDNGYDVYATCRTIPTMGNNGVHWVNIDLFNPIELVKVIRAINAQCLIHLAWDITPERYADATENLKWLAASIQLIENFINCGGQRIITAGSCLEYEPVDSPLNEHGSSLDAPTLYGKCKIKLFQEVSELCRKESVSYVHGRIFYAYGNGENSNRVIPYIIRSLLKDEYAKCSNGEQIRDYIFVRDVAKILVALVDQDVQGPLNIGTGRGIPLLDIMHEIEDICKKKGFIEFGNYPVGEPRLIISDNTRLISEIGYTSFYTIKQGLSETVSWWENNMFHHPE